MEDKDILMIDALRKIIRALAIFSNGTSILPQIKAELDPKRQVLGTLAVPFVNLLLEETNLITEEELVFAGDIHRVIHQGIAGEQAVVLPATDQWNTYIREKTALVEATAKARNTAAHSGDPS
ncbi:MAG: hypothetical protein ACKOA4_04320 [Haliscomenobacter sp.]